MVEENQAPSRAEALEEVGGNAANPIDSLDRPPKAEAEGGETSANGDLHPLRKHSELEEESQAVEHQQVSTAIEIVRNKEDEEEETALDGEFIKVEKETLDVKGNAHTQEPGEVSHSYLETQERVKTLELELEKMAAALKLADSEKTQLKNEVEIVKERLEERSMHSSELELNEKMFQERIAKAELKIREAEEKYNSQLLVLQEALGAQEAKHSELVEAKEALNKLGMELESSRQKLQDLEQELQSSVEEAQRFEEMSKQSDSNTEIASQKVVEFEKLLELATLNTKEMEETLKNTIAELSSVQEQLGISNAQVKDLEQKVSSGETDIKELTEELSLSKASEEQAREEISALQNLCASSKEELETKIAELGELEAKLRDEVNMKEMMELSFKNQELQTLNLQEELLRVSGEKTNLEANILELESNLSHVKDLCAALEIKMKISDEDFRKTESLLAQALSNNSELEQKLKSLEQLHQESGELAAIASQRNLEFQDVIRASNAAEEEAKSQLREIKSRLLSAEQRNLDLEEQLKLAEKRNVDADKKVAGLQEETLELTAILRGVEEETTELKTQLKLYEEKIAQLEISLDQSSVRNSELEMELKTVAEKCSEHEDRASSMQQRSLNLEDLIQISHSKAEDFQKRVADLELLLAVSEQRTRELDEQASALESKSQNYEAESKQYYSKVSELEAELEALQLKATNLEIALQTSNEHGSELSESLSIISEEKKKYEDASNSSAEKLSQVENLMVLLQNELNMTQHKLLSVEQDLNDSGIRESSIMEKLKAAEEELEQQGKVIEQAIARSSELELLHESLAKDSELKVQEAIRSFNERDSEAKELYDKFKMFEDQARMYQEQAVRAAEIAESLKAELEQSSAKLVSMDNAVDELKNAVSEAETRAGKIFSENQIFAETNFKLNQELAVEQSKVNELQTLLSSVHLEREASVEEIASHKKAISELTEQHSRDSEQRDLEAKELNEKLSALETQVKIYEEQVNDSGMREISILEKLKSSEEELEQQRKVIEQATARSSELELLHESLAKDSELKLQEAVRRFSERDSDAKDLYEKLKMIEDQARMYQEQEVKAAEKAESLKSELEQSLAKLVSLENAVDELKNEVSEVETRARKIFSENEIFAEANFKLNQELAAEQSKVNELQTLLSSVHVEREASVEEIASHKKAISELTEQHSRDSEQRDFEVKELNEKLSALETQVKIYEEQVNDSGMREISILEKLKSSEEELEQQRKVIEQATARSSELELLHESLAKDSELKLQEAVRRFSERDSDAKDLYEKLKMIEDQARMYQEQEVKAAEKAESLKSELEQSLAKLVSLENAVDELKNEVSEAETRAGKIFSENQIFIEANFKLNQELAVEQSKVNELQTLLSSVHLEREASVEEIASHKKAISELTEQHSRDSEQRDFEAKELNEKLSALETQVKIYEEQVNDSGMREISILEKLKSSEEELEQQRKVIEQATARSSELELLHESLAKDSELKLQEAVRRFSERDSDAKDLYEKLKMIEDQARMYQEQEVKAAEKAESLKSELEQSLAKLVSLENAVDELKNEVSEAETRARKIFSENQIFAEANFKLNQELAAEQSKVNELQTLLSSVHVEREASVEEIASHKKAISELTEQHSRDSEQRDFEVKELNEKLSALETQVKIYEEQVNDSGMREISILEKLKSSEEELEQQRKVIEQATARSSELELLHESLAKDSELKLQEAVRRFSERDSDAKDLYEKLKMIEDQARMYQEQEVKAAEKAESLKSELEQSLAKLVSLENAVDELKNEVSEAETRAGKIFSENQIFIEANFKLNQELAVEQSKVNELQTLLSSVHLEREASVEEIASHKKAISELTEQHSRDSEQRDFEAKELNEKLSALETQVKIYEEQVNDSGLREISILEKFKSAEEELEQRRKVIEQATARSSELEFLHESLAKDSELKLQEAVRRFSERDSDAKDLYEKLKMIEDQARMYQEQEVKAEEKAESLKSELEQSLAKLVSLENAVDELKNVVSEADTRAGKIFSENQIFAEANFKLNQELAAAQSKINELQTLLSSVHVEKEAFVEEVASHKKAISELTEQHSRYSEQRDFEANELNEKLGALETQVKIYEEQVNDSGLREISILEKFKSAEEELEQRRKVIEQATARSSELELLHESLAKDSELKLQEAIRSFNEKDSEAKDLYDKFKMFEDQARMYQEQAVQAAEKAESLKAELEQSSAKLVSLENSVDELKNAVSEAETKAGKIFSENEIFAEANFKLNQELATEQSKVNELQTLLSSLRVEKEVSIEEIASHKKTISELAEQHSRASEQRDFEAKELNEKLSALETQVKIYEGQVSESITAAETLKVELEEALSKVKYLEGVVDELQSKATQFETENKGLAEVNLKLNQELAEYHTKISELQEKLNLILVEKEETVEQLGSCKKTIEDLTEQLATDRQRLQSQVSSVMEENNLLNESHKNNKKELQAVILQMEERINEQKSREEILNTDLENLKAELVEKSAMQAHVAELEQKLLLVETHFKEEIVSIKAVAAEKEAGFTAKLKEHVTKLEERDVLDEKLVQLQKELHLAHSTITEQKEAESKRDLEREAALEHALKELDSNSQQATLLQKQVEQLEQKLQLADAKLKEQELEGEKRLSLVNAELDGMKSKISQTTELEKKILELENKLQSRITKTHNRLQETVEIKSRDVGSNLSTPPKKRSKKRAEAVITQTAETSSSSINFKFIMGVALISIVFGVILGKRY